MRALVEIALQLGKLPRIPSDLRDREVRAGSDLLFELEILVQAVFPCVLERRDRDGDMERDALFLAQLRDQRDQLHRIEVEYRLGLRFGRIVSGQREHVEELEGGERLQGLQNSSCDRRRRT